MIEVKNLTKYYDNKLAIENLNFSLPRGEIVGLLGLNGSGKTTTLRILTGFLIPSEGEVNIDGKSNFEDPIGTKKRIGYLPESPPLYEDLTVTDYLYFVARLKAISLDSVPEEVERVIQKTNLTEKRNTLLGHLSLGYRKRAGIAQALLGKPPIIVMDEPISGLDPKQILDMRNLIKSLRGEHTIFISSHILSELHKTCDRFLFLHDGRLRFDLTREGLDAELQKFSSLEVKLEGKKTEQLRSYLLKLDKDLKILSAEEDGRGVNFVLHPTDEKTFRESLIDTLRNEGVSLLALKHEEVTLEQMFLKNL